MKKFLKPLTSWWRLSKRIGNKRLAYQLLPEVFTPPLTSAAVEKDNVIIFEKYAKRFTKRQLALFGNHGELLIKFIKAYGISFIEANDKKEIVVIEHNKMPIRLFANNYDNLKVIEEIFIDRLYDVIMQGEYVVCDVGMNVAAASLYFAGISNISKVYGFEPFKDTFEMARKNISLNAGLLQKLEIHNYGLGKKDESLMVPCPAGGALGGSTTASFIEKTATIDKEKLVTVEIKDIAPVIDQIKNSHPEAGIIVKLDCEGAEYDIMEKLDETGLVEKVDIFMIEYHFKGKKPLQDILSANHFLVMSPGDDSLNEYGMLYAINPKAHH